MPEPWAICSRDSRTLPLVASTQTFCQDDLAGVGAADLDLVRQLGAGIAVPDDELGGRGVGDLVDLAAGFGGGAVGATFGRGAGDADGRLLGDRRPDDLAVRVGEDDEVPTDDAQALVGPLVGHRVDAVVAVEGAGADEGVRRGALERGRRDPSPRRRRPAGPRGGDRPPRGRRRPGWRSVPGRTRRRLSLRDRPGRPGEVISLGVPIIESSPEGREGGLGEADQCTSSQSARGRSMAPDLQVRATRKDASDRTGRSRPSSDYRRSARIVREARVSSSAPRAGSASRPRCARPPPRRTPRARPR